jgi:hypothetical protein
MLRTISCAAKSGYAQLCYYPPLTVTIKQPIMPINNPKMCRINVARACCKN